MTSQEYILAWAAYLVGACIVLACFWRLTAMLPWKEGRHLLRLITFIFLLVPWQTDTEHGFMSPAWAVSGADALMYGPEAFWRAGLGLVLAVILGVLLSCIYLTVRWFRSRS